MKVSQKVRRLKDERHLGKDPEWIEDEIYPDVDLDKAYVGRVSNRLVVAVHAPYLTSVTGPHNDTI